MKVTVGGSYHGIRWEEVKKVIEKLKEAGHEVLAPNTEWEPINTEDAFVRFKGEEEKSIADLQKGFFESMEKSDAYIICNPNGYTGFAVAIEIGFAEELIKENENLKQIYFTENPLGYRIFHNKLLRGERLTVEEFKRQLFENPEYENELAFFKKFLNNPEEMIRYASPDDFYEDLLRMFAKISVLRGKGMVTIGIETLLKEKQHMDDKKGDER